MNTYGYSDIFPDQLLVDGWFQPMSAFRELTELGKHTLLVIMAGYDGRQNIH